MRTPVPVVTLPNRQPPERQDLPKGTLDVVDVFYTIQGEGPLAGTPAVFVRLAGCNLRCEMCDTDYTTGRQEMTHAGVVAEVFKAKPGCSQIVLTGGEPFRQQIGPLVRLLAGTGCRVQIETNGTLFIGMDDFPYFASGLEIVCSPKTSRVDERLAPFISAYKYVIQSGHVDEKDGLPTSVLGTKVRPARPRSGVPVYVQPADEDDNGLNALHEQAAVQSCMKFGWRLSYQIHKRLGLP